MKYLMFFTLPLVLCGCLAASGGKQPTLNPSAVLQGQDFVLECKDTLPAENAMLCRPLR